MNITAYFTSGNTPAINLTPAPTVSVWELNGTVAVSAQTMTQIAGGFYTYNFSTYDYTKDYVMRGYASQLAPSERYVIATNEHDSQNTQGIVKQILGLVQSNFRMDNQQYDVDGRLLTANVYTYDNANDADLDINRLHEYDVAATYVNGNLVSYVMTDI